MIESRTPRDPDEWDLRRARIRRKRTVKSATAIGPRRAIAVLTMVDLLSCAFGGAIFLFLLTAALPGSTKGSPPASSEDGFMRIELTSDLVRPVFVLKQTKADVSFVVSGTSLIGRSAHRAIAASKSNAEGGRVYAVGATPWDVEPGARLRVLDLKFEKPSGDWCIRYGTADDDSSARARGENQITGAPIKIKVQGPRMEGYKTVQLEGAAQIPPPLQMSKCYAFKFH